MLENIGLSGKWTAKINRADGSVENFSESNAIQTEFKEKIVDAMVTSDATWRMGNALHSNDGSGQGSNTSSLTAPATGFGGILLNTGGSSYLGMQTTMGSTTAISTGYKIIFTGVVRVTQTYNIQAIYLQRGKQSGSNNYDLDIASGTNWNNPTAINNGDQLTIQWEIKIL